MEAKETTYRNVLRTIEALIAGETDVMAVMATICCELYRAFEPFNWVGFYRRVDHDTLKVGPYQGTHGCLTIDIARGVCGACVRKAVVQLENDVTTVPAHIACSPDTKAEIVLPIAGRDGYVVAVLDIDSTEPGVFDDVDVTCLTEVCRWVSERYREE